MKKALVISAFVVLVAGCSPPEANEMIENFENWDTNGDNCVSRGEFTSNSRGAALFRVYGDYLKRMDGNGDGSICADEVPAN